jgi:hypothetical protein
MITDTIKKQIIEAMKAKNEIRLSTLKLLSSELHNAKIEKRASGPGGDLNEKEEIEVVRREAKKRKEAIEALRQAQGKLTRSDIGDRISKEEKELEILKGFLPKDLSKEELRKIVDETIAKTGAASLQEMGRVIGAVMGKVKGRAEGGRVAKMVKSKLT